MTELLRYHIQNDDLVLSLRYIARSQEEANSVIQDFTKSAADTDANVTATYVEHAVGGGAYPVYCAKEYPREFPSGYEKKLSERELALVDTVVSAFYGVSDRCASRGAPLKWYKRPKPLKIAEALDRVQWRNPVPEVGGQIVSNLTMKHCLPNANHRTAIAFLRTYLTSVSNGSDPDFLSAGNYEGDWHDWAEPFIHESKRLLLLRRKADLLRVAKQQGFDSLIRKSGVTVDLHEYDFIQSDIRKMASQQHLDESVHFTETLLTKSEQHELIEKTDPGKRVLVDRLS